MIAEQPVEYLCNTTPADLILTNPNFLTFGQSGVITNGGGLAYNVDINPNNSLDNCTVAPAGFILPPVITTGGGNIDFNLQEALQIAMEDMEYINYPDVAQWIDERQLFELLEEYETIRNSSTVLFAFWNLKQQQRLGEISEADERIQMLVSEINATNEGDVFDFIEAQNAIEVTDDIWVQNENAMNLVTLKIMRDGINNLNNTEREEIKLLANTCPYIGGSAVFKARTLQGIYEPNAQYNDRVLCLPQAQNKNIDGGNNNNNLDIDSMDNALANQQLGIKNLEEHIKHQLNTTIKQVVQVVTKASAELIKVYPNPTSNYVTVELPLVKEAVFVVTNAIGEVILEQTLNKEDRLTKIDIPNRVANGVYQYQIQFVNKEKYTGKLTIIN